MVNCAACLGPITAGQVNAMGKAWHPKCFVCKMCAKELRSESFQVTEKTKKRVL